MCACVHVRAWRGCRRCADPVPHPHTDAVSPEFPRRKPPDAAKRCWLVVSLAGGSQSRGLPAHRGCTRVCVCGRCGACAQGSAHTHTRFCPSSLRTHVSLLRVCDEPTPTQLSVQMVHPTQRWGFPDSLVAEESTCNAGDPGSIPGWGRSSGEGVGYPLQDSWAAPAAQLVKNLPAVRETWVRSLAWEDLLEKGKAPHSSVLAWRTPWAV